MSVSSNGLIRDKDNIPVPQYYNADTDTFEVITGSGGGFNVTKELVTDIVSGDSTVTKTYSTKQKPILVSNDGANQITLTVGSLILPVNPGEVFDESFSPFLSFSITASTNAYRAIVRG